MNLRNKADRAALDKTIFDIITEAPKKSPLAMVQIEGKIKIEGVRQINIRTSLSRLHAADLINKIGKGPSTRYYRGRKKTLPKGWGE